MKFFSTLALSYLYLVQIIDSKTYRAFVLDEILPYTKIDKNIPPYSEMVSTTNVVFEQIDDENVLVGGYVQWLKSMKPNSPIHKYVRTQYMEQGTWVEGAPKLIIPDLCPEYRNPTRFWYNITKLWTSDVCPPQKGDIWRIEEQNLTLIFQVPPSTPLGPWRAYFLISQGIPGFETNKVGVGFQAEFEPI